MAPVRQGNIGLRPKVNGFWDGADVTASTARDPLSWRPCMAVALRPGLFAADIFAVFSRQSARRRNPDGHEHWRARPLQCVDPQAERDRAILRRRAGLQERPAPAVRFPRRLALYRA